MFFKVIKQNLKIKSFVSSSRKAVLTRIWIAICTYLLMAWIKFSSRIESFSIKKIICSSRMEIDLVASLSPSNK